MLTLLRSIHKVIKQRKNRSLQPIHNEVTYSIGTPCTWKEKLPKMNNSDYILLYGISPNAENLTVDKFKQEYFKKPFELFTDQSYVKKLGEIHQNKFDNDSEIGHINLNYVGIIIRKCMVPETSMIADLIANDFNKKTIANHVEEISFISDYCRKNGVSVYAFPPKYEIIDKRLSTSKLVEPKSYIIVNPNIIVDVAIGEQNIQRMYSLHNNQIQEQKQAHDTEQEKLKRQAEIRKSGRDTINSFNEFAQKVDKKIGNIFKK